MNNISDKINSLILDNKIVLFMKGTKQSPMCGFSAKVVQILDHLKVEYKDINVLADEAMRDGIKIYSDWPTIPQLYVDKEFIGGCDIITQMFTAGELQQLFKEKSLV